MSAAVSIVPETYLDNPGTQKNRTCPGVLLRQCGYLVRIGLPIPEPMLPPGRSDEDPLLCVPRFRVVCLCRISIIVYRCTLDNACQE